MTDNDIVRVTRILTYEGPRKWVDETLAKGQIPAIGRIDGAPHAAWSIRSIVVGEPQYVPPRALTPTPADAVVTLLERAKDGRP